VISQRFTVAKRHVAMFCVGLCMALSVQMTVVVLDRLQHVFQVDHAPNGLAGPAFDHGHHLKVEVQRVADHSHDPDVGHSHDHDIAHSHDHDVVPVHSHDHQDVAHSHDDGDATAGFHTHDWLPQGHDHGPITHHHHGSGMLTPWLVSAPLQIAAMAVKTTVFDFGVAGHPDAPAWRRDRPPKLNLERVV
jgi:hypothetical protein